MIQDLFDSNVFIYVMGGMCLIGILIKFMIAIVYKRLIRASENMGTTGNKLMKMLKLKFEACYKLKIGVNNVDVFVDKYVYKYKFSGILLYTWENLGGQILILCMLTGTVSAGLGLYNECGRNDILSTFFTGILSSSLLIMFESLINLPAKRSVLKANISDYLDNFLKVRLEREYFNPDLLEEYRNEYFDILESVSNKDSKKSRSDIKKERREEKERKKNAEKKEKQLTLSEKQKEELKKESRKAAQVRNSNVKSDISDKNNRKDIASKELNKKEGLLRRSEKVEEPVKNYNNNYFSNKDYIDTNTSNIKPVSNLPKNQEELEALFNSLLNSILEKDRETTYSMDNSLDSHSNKSALRIEDITAEMLMKELDKRKKLSQNEKSDEYQQSKTIYNNQKLKTADNFAATKEDTASHVETNQDLKNNPINISSNMTNGNENRVKNNITNNNLGKNENSSLNNDAKKVKKTYEFTENEEKIIEDILKEFLA